MSFSTTIWQEVEIDVSLDDFDHENIAEYLKESHGYIVLEVDPTVELDSQTVKERLDKLAEQYKSNDPQMRESLRALLQDLTGKVLP